MAKEKPVARPVKATGHKLMHATREAEKGWQDACASFRNAMADAWDFLTHTGGVFAHRSSVCPAVGCCRWCRRPAGYPGCLEEFADQSGGSVHSIELVQCIRQCLRANAARTAGRIAPDMACTAARARSGRMETVS
jgi:hypothetical protein